MPKVRKRKVISDKEIEKFANESDEAIGKKDRMVRTTISFTEEEHVQLKKIANQESRTLQSQVRFILKEFLAKIQKDAF